MQKATFEKGTTSVVPNLFYNVVTLTEVELVDSMTLIGKNAFAYCESLNNITIPEGVETISDSAFINCILLEQIALPESVTDIGRDAFYNCLNLSDVTLSNHLTYLGHNSFGSCTSLTEIHIPKSLNETDANSFYDASPFAGSNLQKATFEEGTTSVVANLFYNVRNLTEVELVNSMTVIGKNAFAYCDSLESITIPDSITTIGHAFTQCTMLEEIIFEGNAPAAMDKNCFENVTATAYYPAGNATWTDDVKQDYGGDITWVARTAEEVHTHSYEAVVTAATCEEGGYTTCICACGDRYITEKTDALGHSFALGTCTVCGAFDPDYELPDISNEDEIVRLAGANRWETSLLVADEMKKNLGIDKFNAIIIASGDNFADALAGSYLSAVEQAPILLCWNGGGHFAYLNWNILDYIEESLAEDGTVYILGGKSAVPMSFDEKLGDRVKRLNGSNRFETNLMILKEAGVNSGEEILVCTSANFADSLSTSATGKPILLVYNEGGTLFEDQKEYLAGLNNCMFTIIGGASAISEKMADLIGTYGDVARVAGANRFETSVLVAEKYFEKPDSAVLAYAWDFPDGLCGGGLAYSMKAPLVLTMTNFETCGAKAYIQEQRIQYAVVLGGETLISDDCVMNIFGTTPTTLK